MTSPTRERILDAVVSVIAQDGPVGATLDAVAAAAGVSKGGLLYHFGTKEALYAGLVERLTRMAHEDVAQWREHEGGVVSAYLQASTIAEGPYTSTLMAVLRLVGTAGVDIEGAVLESFEAWYLALVDATADPVLARTVHLVGDGLYLHALVGARPHPLDEQVVQRLIELAAQGHGGASTGANQSPSDS